MNLFNYIGEQCKKHPWIANPIVATLIVILWYNAYPLIHGKQEATTQKPSRAATVSNNTQSQVYDTLQTTNSNSPERTLQKDKGFPQQDIDTLCKDINTIITQAKSPLKIINIPQWDDEIILTIRSYPSKKELDLKREDLDNEYHIIFHGWKLFEREMRWKNGWEPYAGFELDSAYPKFCKNSSKGVFIQTPTADETKVVLEQQNKLLYKLQELLKIYKITHFNFYLNAA